MYSVLVQRVGALGRFCFSCVLAGWILGPAWAEAHLRDDVVMLWAMNAWPLSDYAALGLGLLGPQDATNDAYCRWQWDPQLAAASGTEACRRVIAVRKAMQPGTRAAPPAADPAAPR